MAAIVKVLIQGTTNADSVAEAGEEKTRPTITLVQEGNLNIVVDPGILENQQILVDALNKEGLTPDDINIVCITHSHIDHYRNIGMFKNAKTLEYYGLWTGESVEDWPEHFSPHIQIIRTPGHDKTGITLLATTENGVVAVCGDIFWKENFPEDPRDDAYASNAEELGKSRKEVLKMSDWIVPGHADIYKVKKGIFDEFKSGLSGKKSKKVLDSCKNCKKPFIKETDNCLCRPWLCYRCCKCDMDCDTCSCGHKKSH